MTIASTPEERAQLRAETLHAMRRRSSRCNHDWTPWYTEGVLSATRRRDCRKCTRAQVAYPLDTG